MPTSAKPDSQRWLHAPPSVNTVRVRIIDSTGNLAIPATVFLEPAGKGHELLNGTTSCFLIENERLGKRAVFDLGLRKDWWNLAPKLRESLGQMAVSIKVDTDVAEVLQNAGVSLDQINDIIWSHAHLDHTGDTSRFPSGTTLNYGKGIAALKPGYPDQLDSQLLTSDFAGRPNREIDFGKSTLKIGGFPAVDFYGDGSFYLLDTPGHAAGHLCGLARVTASHEGQGRDTFVLFGGDVCHFSGMLRPSQTRPLSKANFPGASLRVADIVDLNALLRRHSHFPPSSGTSTADSSNPVLDTPWCSVSTAEYSAYEDPATAQATLNQFREAFDEADNVFVALAHDNNLLLKDGGKSVLPTLNDSPQQDINGWYEKGWKDKLHWSWLGELGKEDKYGNIKPMEPHVVGYWKNGKKYDSAAEILHQVEQQETSAA
ncbi:metallo-beta-lactamase superfamily protein [Trichoderma gamsii]|uniref:Metallo-beta-lactamase superfamily protein n=1 Tax=Trichoderma gamsii TaxID=398673 RepID=A0A2P4ZR28_9HYPO|nr:metallo-beta-lactamase superfamily protein [Trichoderma gamsii]PON26713.1 metallo-beta-lactamase superfamily protein [Trichoderma gamsii]